MGTEQKSSGPGSIDRETGHLSALDNIVKFFTTCRSLIGMPEVILNKICHAIHRTGQRIDNPPPGRKP